MIRQRASLGRLACKTGILIRNEAQEKHLSFVPKSIVAVVSTGSRVKMNAQRAGALDPALTTLRVLCAQFALKALTGADEVIHGQTVPVLIQVILSFLIWERILEIRFERRLSCIFISSLGSERRKTSMTC